MPSDLWWGQNSLWSSHTLKGKTLHFHHNTYRNILNHEIIKNQIFILVQYVILDLKFPQNTSCVTVNMTLNYSGIGRHRERDPSKVIWLHWLKYPTNWAYNTNNLNQLYFYSTNKYSGGMWLIFSREATLESTFVCLFVHNASSSSVKIKHQS